MSLRPGLFVEDNTGNGVTAPQDARLALAALLSGPGILTGGAVTGSSSGPNMQYVIADGRFATARGSASSDGLYVFPNIGPLTVDSNENGVAAGPAPASGSRYDLIWVRHKNAYSSDGFGDADSLPQAGVTAGTAASSPTKPYASVPAGALVLAESEVGANDASAAAATITMVAVRAGAHAYTSIWQYEKTSVQSIASGTFARFTMDVKDIDDFGVGLSSTGSSFAAPFAGRYRVTGGVGWAANATGRRGAQVAVNNNLVTASKTLLPATAIGAGVYTCRPCVIDVNAGDIIGMWGFQDSGAALSTSDGSLCVELIRPA